MSTENPEGESPVFQLAGRGDTFDLHWVLAEGAYSIGSARENDIVIPLPGASKRHARLVIRRGDCTIDDLQSKNGVFVNGCRVAHSPIENMDELRIGTATLIFRRVEPDDVTAGIEFKSVEDVSSESVGEAEDTTTDDTDRTGFSDWIRLLGEFSGTVSGLSDPKISSALARVVEILGCRGAGLYSRATDGSLIVLGSFGDVVEPVGPAFEAALAQNNSTDDGGFSVVSAVSAGEPPLAWAVSTGSDAETCALLVVGDFPRRRSCRPLLETLLRMAVAGRQNGPPPQFEDRPRRELDLAFAPNHVSGRSEAILTVYEQLRQLLQGDVPVLISGETGVGKEPIARLLHDSSPRARHPFVAVNCAAIPEDLLESELFGIRSGVATGVTERKGKFETAKGGTIVLDEIGDMPLGLQAKLLRAVQEMEVHPLGAHQPVPVDVRIISISNASLPALVKQGKFRRDLYYRIAGFTLEVPPLRDRRADIPLLVDHFLRRHAFEINKTIEGISVKALRLLTLASWPGNVRELSHEVRRLVYLCPEHRLIDSSMLSPSILAPPVDDPLVDLKAGSDLDLERHAADLERLLITIALARTRNNRTKAAKLLGISRNGLALKIERLGMTV